MAFKKFPAYKARFGVVEVSVWAQVTQKKVFYNTTFSRGYQNPQTGQWEKAESFGFEDLGVLHLCLQDAASWIIRQMAENERNAGGGGQAGPGPREDAPGAGPGPAQPQNGGPQGNGRGSRSNTNNPGSTAYYEGAGGIYG